MVRTHFGKFLALAALSVLASACGQSGGGALSLGSSGTPSPTTVIATFRAQSVQTGEIGGCAPLQPNGYLGLFCNGMIYTTVNFPAAGSYSMSVMAYGQYSLAWPQMQVVVDPTSATTIPPTGSFVSPAQAVVGATALPNALSTPSNYTFQITVATAGIHQVGVAFINDYANVTYGDRNLFIDTVTVSH
jgi:hypothetical protein